MRDTSGALGVLAGMLGTGGAPDSPAPKPNCVVLLGPTAAGKTALAVRLARSLGAEIISADSRQVYRGLDLGSGKDLAEYAARGSECAVPYHVIDVASLDAEYCVYNFLQDAYRAFDGITARGRLPLVVGGSGMYLDALLRDYGFPKGGGELAARRAREKAAAGTEPEAQRGREKTNGGQWYSRPRIAPLILGTMFPRGELRERIAERLRARFRQGMLAETERLHESGASWERLERLGLEYRFAARFLQGKIESRDELFRLLCLAIGQFAKRQETWFRGIAHKGFSISWLPPPADGCDGRFERALELICRALRLS
nr:tRNA (adenosine(37)-N6)-dimethylallyltransferase MiaA [Treponema endosymbiont of Eucomonympha sp.]